MFAPPVTTSAATDAAATVPPPTTAPVFAQAAALLALSIPWIVPAESVVWPPVLAQSPPLSVRRDPVHSVPVGSVPFRGSLPT